MLLIFSYDFVLLLATDEEERNLIPRSVSSSKKSLLILCAFCSLTIWMIDNPLTHYYVENCFIIIY